MNLQQKKELIDFSIVTLVFSVIACIVMLVYFSRENNYINKQFSKQELEALKVSPVHPDSTKTILLPLEASFNNQSFHFTSICSGTPSSPRNSWFYVAIEVLDENKNYEYATGLNYWDEAGYDSEGAWTASELQQDFKFVRTKKGKFYIKITSIDYDVIPYNLTIQVVKRGGSTIAFWLLLFGSVGAIFILLNYKEGLSKRKKRVYYD